ncbi:hypothetical protein M5K25_001755 [Dendrobium thyrsiflorum]|uniref:Maturase K n=1 Tax=Dendrobium thyrsiflorum TaxID=117978 RepID=A0ABD0VR38_DENTH
MFRDWGRELPSFFGKMIGLVLVPLTLISTLILSPMLRFLPSFKMSPICKIIHFIKPPKDQVKLNINGSSSHHGVDVSLETSIAKMASLSLKHTDLDFLASKNHSMFFRRSWLQTTHYGLPTLWISKEEIQTLVALFEFVFVGKFYFQHPVLDSIRNFFSLLSCGEFLVTLLDPRHILIKLSNNLDYSRSLMFDIFAKSRIVSLWTYFPDLHPHLFSHRILHGLGSLFDHQLQTDSTMASGSCPTIA